LSAGIEPEIPALPAAITIAVFDTKNIGAIIIGCLMFKMLESEGLLVLF